MPTDAQRVQNVFLAAAEFHVPAERSKFLDEACAGDTELRARVEALLRAHDHPDSLLDHPAVAPHDPEAATTRTFGSDSAANDEIPLTFLAPPQRPDSLGRIGHYEVLQVLGQGGFGIVFRAFDEVLQRVVAVKVLSPHMAATSPARKRFTREARSSAQVRHENVVQVYEVGETPLPYLVMEFIPGETLQQRLDRIGPLDVPDILRIGRQIAEGLAAAHATDLIHRDIKPGNVLLEGGQQRVKITDFGLARAADDASISQSGIIAGTPMFMAPEQAKGDKLDHRADLFSLGSVLYQMAAGRPPFRANSTVAVLKRVAEDTPRPIREIIPEAPQWLCDIISKLHAKNPDDRFQSAREVADLLAECEAELKANGRVKTSVQLRAIKPAARPSGKSGRWKWVVAAAVLLLPLIALAVMAIVGVSVLFRGIPGPGLSGVEPTPNPPTPDPIKGGPKNPASPTDYTNTLGMKFKLIPAGKFTMGSSKEEIDRGVALAGVRGEDWAVRFFRSEGPAHEVELTQPFFMGVTEVTVGQFRRFVEEARYQTVDVRWKEPGFAQTDDHPVVWVSWQNAVDFCAWLSKKEGKQYRLPTEAEWEYSCRAGKSGTRYGFGDDDAQLEYHAWYEKTSGGWTRPVGQKKPNDWGLYDMHGNAWEWCRDGYDPNYYQNSPAKDPMGPDSSEMFVVHGGSWRDAPLYCRSAFRIGPNEPPGNSNNRIGFRVVLVPAPGGVATPPPAEAPTGTSPWTVLKPIEMKSEGGASLTLQPDASILVSGKHPANDSYTLTFRGLPTTIQALRLEVLPHDSLPNKGPGRHGTGQFSLTTIKVQLDPPAKPGEPRVLKLAKAWADNIRGTDCLVDFAIDADDNTGWVTEAGKPHFAVFEFAEPVPVTEGTVLRVTLEFKHPEQPQLELGCFRLSVVEDLTADRKTAEHVLSLGGMVKVNDLNEEIRIATGLPPIPFRLTYANLWEKQMNPAGLAGLAVFKGCKYLKELELHRSNITDAELAHLKDHKDLTFLNLTGTPITDAGLAHFKGCNNLWHLTLADTRVTDAGLANFKDCKGLKELWLYNTSITDVGLATFKDCKNLTSINLHATQVTDAGLAQLKDCKDLTTAHLSSMQVTDAGLAHLKNCTKLLLLNLADTQKVTDAGLAHLTGLNALTELNLTNTKVTAKGVEALAKALPRCKIQWPGGVIEPIDVDRRAAEYVLSIGGSVRVDGAERDIKASVDLPKAAFRLTAVGLITNQQVTNAGLAVFKDCRNLTVLDLVATPITDAGLIHLQDCKKLTTLHLAYTQTSDAGLAFFKACPDLIYINLHKTQVTDAGLAVLKDWKNLATLNLAELPVTDAGLVHLKECKNLTGLYLNDTQVTDAGLAHLAGLDKLVELTLLNTKVTAKGAEGLAKALPKCKITWTGGTIEPKPAAPAAPPADADRKAAEYALSVGGEVKVNEQGPVIKAVADLPREAFRLTRVGLPNNKQVTDAGLAAFAGCKNLGGLQLEGTPVTDAGLIHLKDCTNLTGLDLTGTKVTDAGLVHLKDCKNLTYLQLADTQVTDAGLAHFKDCKNLTHLNLARTQVRDAGLAQLKDRNNLATLQLEGTLVTDAGLAHLTGLDKLIELKLAKTKVTAEGVKGLAKALPKCKITSDGGVIEPK